MSTPEVKSFRSELQKIESVGEMNKAYEFVGTCEEKFGDPTQLAHLRLEKARLAFILGKWDECLSLLDQIESQLNLLDSDSTSRFFVVSSRLHQGYGDLNQALALLEIAVAEAEASESPSLIDALIEIATLFHRIGERERGNEFLDRAGSLISKNPNSEQEAALVLQRGLLAIRTDELGEAEAHYGRVHSLLAHPDKPSLIKGAVLRFQGVLAVTDGNPEDALALQRKSLDCFRALPHPLGEAKALNSLGQTCLSRGDFEEARFFLERAEQVCFELGAEAERATILGKLGRVCAQTGEHEKAIEYQRKDLDLSSRFGNYRALAFSLRNLGLSYRAKGELEQAVKYLRDSRDRFTELEDHAFQVRTDLDLVSALLEHDRLAEAFGYLRDAQEHLDRRMETSTDHVHARYFDGVIAFQSERFHEAETLLWQALEMCDTFGLRSRQVDVHLSLAELYLSKDDQAAAVEELSSAYKLAKKRSDRGVLSKITARLFDLCPDRLFSMLHGQVWT